MNIEFHDFKHECPDWDFMVITLHDAEAVGCSCFRGEAEADVLYEARSRELDEHNAKMCQICSKPATTEHGLCGSRECLDRYQAASDSRF